MTDIVPASEIEAAVGAARHPTEHYGRAVSDLRQVYILHSQECKNSTPDLRDCPFSKALDHGIEAPTVWEKWEYLPDRTVHLGILHGYLVPCGVVADGGNR